MRFWFLPGGLESLSCEDWGWNCTGLCLSMPVGLEELILLTSCRWTDKVSVQVRRPAVVGDSKHERLSK